MINEDKVWLLKEVPVLKFVGVVVYNGTLPSYRGVGMKFKLGGLTLYLVALLLKIKNEQNN